MPMRSWYYAEYILFHRYFVELVTFPGDAEWAYGGEGDALGVDRAGRGLQEAGQATDGGWRRAIIGFETTVLSTESKLKHTLME